MNERRKDPRTSAARSLENWLKHCEARLNSSLVLANDDGLLIDESGAGDKAELLAAYASYSTWEYKKHNNIPSFLRRELQQTLDNSHLSVRPIEIDNAKVFLVCKSDRELPEEELDSVCDGVRRIL